MEGFSIVNLAPPSTGEPGLNDPDKNNAIPKSFLYDQFHPKSATYTRTAIDEKVDAKLDTNGGVATGTLSYAENQPILTGPQDIPSYGVVTDLLAQKKDTGTFDTKIQNASAKTAVSCDGDLYISVKSNGNKLCDIHEDTIT